MPPQKRGAPRDVLPCAASDQGRGAAPSFGVGGPAGPVDSGAARRRRASRGGEGDTLGGALLYRSRTAPRTLFWWKAGLRADARDDDFRALEVAVLRHAIAGGFTSLNMGLARAIASDGILVHKRRLGCDFAGVPGGTTFRLQIAAAARAPILAAVPLVVTHDGRLEAWHGIPDLEPRSVSTLARRLADGVFPSLAALRVFAPRHSGGPLRARLEETAARGACARLQIIEG